MRLSGLKWAATVSAAQASAAAAPISLVGDPLTDSVVGQPYTHSFTLVGGQTPFDSPPELLEGALPPGMTMTVVGRTITISRAG